MSTIVLPYKDSATCYMTLCNLGKMCNRDACRISNLSGLLSVPGMQSHNTTAPRAAANHMRMTRHVKVFKIANLAHPYHTLQVEQPD